MLLHSAFSVLTQMSEIKLDKYILLSHQPEFIIILKVGVCFGINYLYSDVFSVIKSA